MARRLIPPSHRRAICHRWRRRDSSDENGIAKHDVALSLDGGATYTTIGASINGSKNFFDYQLPAEIFSDNAKIQITAVDYAGNKIVDTSDKVFAIQRETIPP